MKNLYYLQIDVEDQKILWVDEILGVEHNTMDFRWQFLISEGESTIDYINLFMDLLEGKYKAMEEKGISRSMISMWHIYGYDSQCNFEYSPRDLERLGNNGITLYVSCWDTGEEPILVDNILN